MPEACRTVQQVLRGKTFQSWSIGQQRRAELALREAVEEAAKPPAPPTGPGVRVAPVAGQVPSGGVRSKLTQVLWLNLDRRTDRADAQREALKKVGLDKFEERVSAVNGQDLDLESIPEDILTERGRKQAMNPPAFVLGRVLTPGVVGLWLTWHKVLVRIANEAAPHECYIVAEDDAEYCEHFQEQLAKTFAALDGFDSQWNAAAIGFIRSKTRITSLLGDGPVEGDKYLLDYQIGRIRKLTGAAAIVVRGATGAKALLQALFPVDSDSQLDLKFSTVVDYYGAKVRMYCSAEPLAAAPLSEAGDSDIQRIPAAKAKRFKLEARIRAELGDEANIAQTSVEELISSSKLSEILAEPGMPQLDEDAVKGLVRDVWNSLEAINKPLASKVKWSLAEPMTLVGTWTEWREPFTEMRRVPGHASACRAEVPVRAGAVEEFQILVGGDWKRRFFPMEANKPNAHILGPLDRHGNNFARLVPPSCERMIVTWDPVGVRSLEVTFDDCPCSS